MNYDMLIVCDRVVDQIPPGNEWRELKENVCTVINLRRMEKSFKVLPYIYWLLSRVIDAMNMNISADMEEGSVNIPYTSTRDVFLNLIKGMREDIAEMKVKLLALVMEIKEMGEAEHGFLQVLNLHIKMTQINIIIDGIETKLADARRITGNRESVEQLALLVLAFSVFGGIVVGKKTCISIYID